MSGQPEPEELLRSAAWNVDREAMVRVSDAERAAAAEAERPSLLRPWPRRRRMTFSTMEVPDLSFPGIDLRATS